MGCARLSIQEDARKSGCCNCSFQGDSSLHFFPRCRFFRSSPMAESVQQATIGEVGLGSRTTLLLYLLYKQAHIYAARTGK